MLSKSDAPEPPADQRTWIKSTKSSGSGCCVEVSLAPDEVLIRDSKFPRCDPDAGPEPIIAIDRSSWLQFLDGIPGRGEPTPSLEALPQPDRGMTLRSLADGVELNFTAPEWARLRGRCRRGRAALSLGPGRQQLLEKRATSSPVKPTT